MLRVALAAVYARTLADGSWLPLGVFVVAAASDYVDGPLARRAGGPTRHGVLLDSVADIVFVLTAAAAGVAIGRIAWIVPVAMAGAATPYLVATVRRSGTAGRPERAFSRIGHWAGVCNYALAGLLAGSVALPAPSWRTWLQLAGILVAAVNVAAVAARLQSLRVSH